MIENKHSKVEYERIETGLANCRSDLPDIEQLAADIEERGLLQPLVVLHKHLKSAPHELPDGRKVWDRYTLLAGHRRFAAIGQIREKDPGAWATVPVTIFVGNEDDALFAQVSENLSRRDLSPTDLAEAIFRFRKRGHSIATIAEKLAQSPRWVGQLCNLRERGTSEVLRATQQGRVPITVAMTLAKLDDEQQGRELSKYLVAVEAAAPGGGADGSGGKGGKGSKGGKEDSKAKRATPAERTAARAALDAAAGKAVRPSLAEVRARLEVLQSENDGRGLGPVGETLRWVLGYEPWGFRDGRLPSDGPWKDPGIGWEPPR